jgi:hypothetical protein
VTVHAVPDAVDPLDKPAAVLLDKRIRLQLGRVNDSLTKLYILIEQARHGQVHTTLGYRSWQAYVVDVFTPKISLGREQRRELVEYLCREGMSNRGIADVIDMNEGTVRNDRKASAENSAPSPNEQTPVDLDSNRQTRPPITPDTILENSAEYRQSKRDVAKARAMSAASNAFLRLSEQDPVEMAHRCRVGSRATEHGWVRRVTDWLTIYDAALEDERRLKVV